MSEASSAEVLEATLKEHPILRQGEYELDPAKFQRLLDALSHSSSSSRASVDEAPPAPDREAADDEDYSEELPVNWVQHACNRITNYCHNPNQGLNWKLTATLALAATLVLGLGVGHFMGSRFAWFKGGRVARQQTEQLRALQDSLLSCLAGKEQQEAGILGLRHRLTACIELNSHCGPEDKPLLTPPDLSRPPPLSVTARPLPSVPARPPPRDSARRRRDAKRSAALLARLHSLRRLDERRAARERQLEAKIQHLEEQLTLQPPPPTEDAKACPAPSRSERDQIAQSWLNYANLTQILDSYLDALRGASLGSLQDDTVTLVREQLAQVGEAAEAIRAELGGRLEKSELRQTLETALSRVWAATSQAVQWAPDQDRVDLFIQDLQDDLSQRLHDFFPPRTSDQASQTDDCELVDQEEPDFYAPPEPSLEPPAPKACRLAPESEPNLALRQWKGVLKRSGLWDAIGATEVYPYIGELKRLSKQWPLSDDGAAWWQQQQLWWLGCAPGDPDLDWQKAEGLDRATFLAENPTVDAFVQGWLEEESPLLSRGRGRAEVQRLWRCFVRGLKHGLSTGIWPREREAVVASSPFVARSDTGAKPLLP